LPAALAPNLKVQWNFTTHGVIVAAPIVVNDTVFVGSWDGNEYALNASSGAVRWATYLGQSATAGCGSNVRGVSSTATFDSGVLYVGGGHSQWFALNASTGVILWNVSTGNPLAEYNWGSPLIVGSYAYVGLASACDHPLIRGELMQVNLTSHMVDHIFYTVGPSAPGGSIWGSPTYDPLTNDVLAATGNGWAKYPYPYTQSLLAFNAMNVSNLAGHYQIPRNATGPDSDFGSTPTLVQDSRGNPRVVVANKDGLLYAFNRTNITAGPVWADNISVGGPCPECAQGSISPAAFDGKFIYAGGGKTTINGKWYRGGERQIDPSNGTVLWARGFPAPVVPATSAANGVLVIEAGMKLYVLNASTGQTLRAFAAHTLLYASAAISERCIFFGSTDFHVYALGVPGVACGPIAPVGHLPHLAHGPGHPPESKHPARPMPQAIRATLVRSRPGSSRGPA
jgi:outer membrane protein assembly factor BamB